MDVEVQDGGAKLALRGRLDARSVPDARDALHRAVDRGTGDLVVDLDGLEIWDAAALGVLLGAHRRAERRGRRLVLVRVPDGVARMLRMTRLHRVLHVEAAAALAG